MSTFHFLHRSLTLLVIAVLSTISSGRAQNASTTLSLREALERAAEYNPALNAARYYERAAEALTEQAALRPNPTLDVSLENFGGT